MRILGANLLLVSLFSRSSGETYWAVPTNVSARSTKDDLLISHRRGVKDSERGALPGPRILPVPKSVILIRKSASKRRFSGFRSLMQKSIYGEDEFVRWQTTHR